MAHYMHAPEFGKPAPAHTLTTAAIVAVEEMRIAGGGRRIDRWGKHLIVDHGVPKRRPYDGVRITSGARSLEKAATAAGFDVRTIDHATGCRVEGIHRARRVGFVAYWERGATVGATWHSGGRDRWKLVDISSRPIGVDANAKTTKARCRHDENDVTRLELVESPRGVHVNITELTRRIKA